MTKVGLHIDVNTFRGTREGVPCLLEILSKRSTQADILFSIGPGSMGRHFWQLVKPRLLWRMLRSDAASLCSWDILLAGTAWLGKEIGHINADIIRKATRRHEAGLHAWDHYAWQARSGNWDRQIMVGDTARSPRTLEEIIGQPIACPVAAGWCANQQVIEAKEAFHLRYNSDCRGATPSRPLFESGAPGTVQIPVTSPTWDEVISRGVRTEDFSGWLLNHIQRDKDMPAYTIHAEVEDHVYQHNLVGPLKRAAQEGVTFCPLGELLSETLSLG